MHVSSGTRSAEDHSGFFASGELEGAKAVSALRQRRGLGLVHGDRFFAIGAQHADRGGLGAVFVRLEEDADFVVAGLLHAEGKASAGGLVTAEAVVLADERLQAFAVGPFAVQFGFGVVDDDSFELLRVDAIGGSGDGNVGEFFGILGQVEIGFERVTTHRAGLVHEILQDVEILLIHTAWAGVVAHADPGGFADDFAHHAASAHDARGTERFTLDTDVGLP